MSSTEASAGDPWTITSSRPELFDHEVTYRAARLHEALGHRALPLILRAQGVGIDEDEGAVAYTPRAAGLQALEPLPDFEGLIPSEEEVAWREDVPDFSPLEDVEDGVEALEVAVDIREEGHRA